MPVTSDYESPKKVLDRCKRMKKLENIYIKKGLSYNKIITLLYRNTQKWY